MNRRNLDHADLWLPTGRALRQLKVCVRRFQVHTDFGVEPHHFCSQLIV